MVVLSDSVVAYATDEDGTQIPYSPSQILTTNVAQQTLRDLELHERSVAEVPEELDAKHTGSCKQD